MMNSEIVQRFVGTTNVIVVVLELERGRVRFTRVTGDTNKPEAKPPFSRGTHQTPGLASSIGNRTIFLKISRTFGIQYLPRVWHPATDNWVGSQRHSTILLWKFCSDTSCCLTARIRLFLHGRVQPIKAIANIPFPYRNENTE